MIITEFPDTLTIVIRQLEVRNREALSCSVIFETVSSQMRVIDSATVESAGNVTIDIWRGEKMEQVQVASAVKCVTKTPNATGWKEGKLEGGNK